MQSDTTIKSINSHISESRTFVMGVSMMVIMLFHQHFVDRALFEPISGFGLWGVDLFMFVSGFGCAHSLMKGAGQGHWIRQFYWRRALRIMPAALIAGWFMLPFRDVVVFKDYIGMHLWYMKVIAIFYVIAPFAFILVCRLKNRVWVMGSVVALLMAIIIYVLYCIQSLPFWSWDMYNLRGRLPAFVLGIALVLVDERLRIRKSWWLLAAVAGVLVGEALYLVKDDIEFPESNFYLILPALPMFCAVCTVLRRHAGDALVRIVEWFGKYSLELYLVHEFLYARIGKIVPLGGGWTKLAAAFAISAASAALLHFIAKIAVAWIGGICGKIRLGGGNGQPSA